MKTKFYITYYLNYALYLIRYYYFNIYIYLFIFVFLLLFNFSFCEPMLCDSIESVNDATCSCSLNSYSVDNTIQEENITREYERFEFDNESLEPHCINIIDKYKNICKRRLYWFTCVKNKSPFNTYKEFKPTWKSNTQVITEIKKGLRNDIEPTLKNFRLTKRTIYYLFKPNKPGGGRGL